MVTYLESPLISKCSCNSEVHLARLRIHIQYAKISHISISRKEYLEIEIFRRTIYKNIKDTKYLGMNIIKYEYNLYIEDYKILLREIIEDPNKWRKILSS